VPEKPEILFLSGDVYDFEKTFEEIKAQKKQKFDVITIANAIHWFDYEKLLKFLKENLLEENGSICIIC